VVGKGKREFEVWEERSGLTVWTAAPGHQRGDCAGPSGFAVDATGIPDNPKAKLVAEAWVEPIPEELPELSKA
jgi:hypothetical protein